MPNLKPILQKQFLVLLDSKRAYFTKISGILQEKDVAEYNDGETGMVRKHLGFMKNGDVTLSKPFDPVQDKDLIAWWQSQNKDPKPFTVAIQPVNTDLEGTPISGSSSILLQDCQVSRFKYPDVDREGSGMAMLEITVLPGAIAYQ